MVGRDSYSKEDEETKFKYEEISCMSPRGERFKKELLSKIVPWENITESLQHFPYYLEQSAKALLTECVASHLKQIKLRKLFERLKSSNDRILLQSIAGTGRYVERLVSAVAREFQVPLLKFDVDHDYIFKESDSDCDDDRYDNYKDENIFQIGDRVQCYASRFSDSILSSGQQGDVCKVDGDRVLVVINTCGLTTRAAETSAKAILTWLDVKYVRKVKNARTHDWFIAMEALYEALMSHQQPLIVYFPDSHLRISKSSNYSTSDDQTLFYGMMCRIFNQSPEGVVMICRCTHSRKWEAASEEMKKLPESLKKYVKRLEDQRSSWHYNCYNMTKLFTNVVSIKPPKDRVLVNKFLEQIEEDRLAMISEGNLSAMHKVLKAHNLSCMNLEQSQFEDMLLTAKRVEKIVGWATNHYLSTCDIPCVSEGKVHIPLESIKLATLRLTEKEPWYKKQSYLRKEDMEEETQPKKTPKNIQNLASTVHERRLVQAIVCSEDIGLKFDDVGVLESVKKPLFETVILPVRRPRLFSHGNLLRPCQGILLYGPPGTGKTLIAKALAAESGANFINVTAAAITSHKRNREAERETRAIFSYAIKLAPVIVYVDEDDILLIPEGHNKHDTIRLNEFIAAWDAFNSPGSLVVVSTNRPYDLDEAVIRRMTKRIYVGLPDVENRRTILKALLEKQNVESEFLFEKVAEATEGYSGSDLKNLCCVAAYRTIQEFFEQESKGEGEGVAAPRPLNLDDFIHSKPTVRASAAQYASSIIKMREWNEQCVEAETQR